MANGNAGRTGEMGTKEKPMQDGKSRGLDPEGRYHVTKISDPEGKHTDCRYFVLDPRHDPLAVPALAEYAKQARAAGYGTLADDLDRWVASSRG